jgi:ABC-type uncharacterized transport system substrate-binding protein
MAVDIARREFIASLGGGALAWPIAARAERAGGTPKIGVLMPFRESDPEMQGRIAALRQGLADLGWEDGQNIHIEYRWADVKIELLHQYAEELVALSPDIIIADSTPVRRSAAYVDRILKGANPADLPVQEPIKFEFIINLKTAQSFGLAIPSGVLSIADEVIQ